MMMIFLDFFHIIVIVETYGYFLLLLSSMIFRSRPKARRCAHPVPRRRRAAPHPATGRRRIRVERGGRDGISANAITRRRRPFARTRSGRTSAEPHGLHPRPRDAKPQPKAPILGVRDRALDRPPVWRSPRHRPDGTGWNSPPAADHRGSNGVCRCRGRTDAGVGHRETAAVGERAKHRPSVDPPGPSMRVVLHLPGRGTTRHGSGLIQ